MRRWIFTFVAMITFTVSANALSYTQARTEALFLTDKMAYELGLNTIQQEMVYEINLDYLLTISGTSGYYSIYWDRRNADLRYVLTTSQYRRYCNVPYFYRGSTTRVLPLIPLSGEERTEAPVGTTRVSPGARRRTGHGATAVRPVRTTASIKTTTTVSVTI